METSLRPTSASYEEITFLGCYLALKARKEKHAPFDFENYKGILSNVCEDCRQWKIISEETLKPLGLENEFYNSRIENLINESGNEFMYASTGKIYDFGNREIIPCNNRRYFLLVTICLNNFSDTHVKKLLAHQLALYPDKAEFLEQLKLTVREQSKKVIAKSKAQTVLEWIEKQPKHIVRKKKIKRYSTSLKRGKKVSEKPIPVEKDFQLITGKLSKKEIDKFFSFLCLEKNRNGMPFLPKAEVDKLLENGFGVGEKPTGKYFNLNINDKQNGLIKYCFFRFYKCHEGDHGIRDAIVRFLIFNFEQFKPEDGKYNAQVHENFYRNFNGTAPRRMPFLISRYLHDQK